MSLRPLYTVLWVPRSIPLLPHPSLALLPCSLLFLLQVDIGLQQGVLKRSGAWYSYADTGKATHGGRWWCYCCCCCRSLCDCTSSLLLCCCCVFLGPGAHVGQGREKVLHSEPLQHCHCHLNDCYCYVPFVHSHAWLWRAGKGLL